MSHRYRLYGAALTSSIRFAGLDQWQPIGEQATSGRMPCEISLVSGRVAVPARPPDHLFTTTGSPDGPVWLKRHEQPTSSILEFPGLLRAQLGPADVVTIDAHHGVEASSVEHLVLDNVIPLALARQGLIVLHGGAVQLPSGRCVAFVGPSGAGKSTLVAGLNLEGLGLISDDCLVIRDADGNRQLATGHRRSRLLGTSIDLLGATSSGAVAPMTSKRWVAAAGSIDERSMQLDALVALDVPEFGRRPPEGSTQRIRPSAGLIEMIRHSFHRPHDHQAAARWFGELAALARCIPSYRMTIGEGVGGIAAAAGLLNDADRRSTGRSGLEIGVGPIGSRRSSEELVGR